MKIGKELTRLVEKDRRIAAYEENQRAINAQKDFEEYNNASSTYLPQSVLELILKNPRETLIKNQRGTHLYSKPNYLL